MAGLSRTGEPRKVALVGFGASGEALAADAATAAEGVVAVAAKAYAAGDGAGDTLVLVARPEEPCDDAGAVFDRALRDGQLAIGVIVSEGETAAGGTAASALRPRADILVTTTDAEFLEVLARWLERPA